MASIPQQRFTPSGADRAAVTLADRLEGFKNKFLDTANRENVRIGVRKAAEVEFRRGEDGITEAPEFRKEGFFGAAQNKAYNLALQDSYVASLENDIRGQLTRLQVEFSDDIAGYESGVKGFRRAIAKEADPRVRQIALRSVDERFASGYGSVLAKSRAKQQKIAYMETTALTDAYQEEARQAAQLGNLTEAAEGTERVNQTIDQMLAADLITEPEAAIKKKEALAQIKQDTIIGSVKKSFEDGKPEEAIKSIQEFRDRDIPELSVTERDTIAKAALDEVRQTFAIERLLETEEQAAVKNIRDANETELYLGIAEGDVRPSDVNTALRDGRIDLAQATKLNNLLTTRGQGVDDYSLIIDIQQRIDRGENVRSQIINATGGDLSEATAAKLLRINNEEQDSLSSGPDGPKHYTKDPDFIAAKRFVSGAMTVVGQYGVKTFEDQKRKADAELLLHEQAAEVARNGGSYIDLAERIVGIEQTRTGLRYFDKGLAPPDDPDKALKALEARARDKNDPITWEQYSEQKNLIMEHKKLQEAQRELRARQKEARGNQ